MLSCQHFYRTQLVSLVPGKVIVKNKKETFGACISKLTLFWWWWGGKGKILVLNGLCDM